jgi:hypothetical protein
MKGRLVKWDALIVGETPPETETPETHPGCIEIIEMNEGQDPKTVYRRPENADDSRRSHPR